MSSASLCGSVLLLALASAAHAETFTCSRRHVVDGASARCSFTAGTPDQRVAIRRVDVWANAPGWFCGSTDVQVSVGGRRTRVNGLNEEWKGATIGAEVNGGAISLVTKNLNSHCDADIETKVTYDVLTPSVEGVEVEQCSGQKVSSGTTATLCGFGQPYPLEVVGFEMGVELTSWFCSGSSDLRVTFGDFVRFVEVSNGGSAYIEMAETVLSPGTPVAFEVANENSNCAVRVSPKVSYRRVETPAPATPAPATSAPATSAPATPAPATAAPATDAPATQAPPSDAPATQAPPTSAPATSAPATPAPATSAPATSAPATPAPATSAPATPAPATSAPATSAPATSAPATSAPTVAAAPCKDKESEQYCVGYKHFCKYSDFAADCAATCNTCPGATPAPVTPKPSCVDTDERYCVVYKHLCYIQNFKEEQCPVTCGACPEGQ